MAKTIAEVKEAYNDAVKEKVDMTVGMSIIFVAIIIGLMLIIALSAIFRFTRLRNEDGFKHQTRVILLLLICLVFSFSFFALVT